MMARNRNLTRHALAAAVAILTTACGSDPVTPPPVTNTPPTIESLTTPGPRAEADSPIQLAAVVKDLESTLDRLTYTWSASPQTGTFGGTTSFVGNQVINTWRPPKGQTSPNVYTIGLTVTEAYTSAGQAKLNTVSSSTTVHYNDSPAEVTNLGTDFLVNKFSNYNVSPAEAVSNFSDSCAGKAAELSDITENRESFHILSGRFTPMPPTFNASLTSGTIEGFCEFEDIPKSGPNAGRREYVSGTCHLTNVYENFRWYLCESSFLPPYNTTLASLKGRVPGHLIHSN